jgi:hypothetical protein
VDAKLDQPLTSAALGEQQAHHAHVERLISRYWLVATVAGVVFVWDWITAWNVAATLRMPALVIYLVLSFALSQVLYALVAHHDGRAIRPWATLLFAVGNGVAETFAFAAVFRVGMFIGEAAVGLVAPGAASIAGLIGGIAAFCVYGGLIHGLFWLRVLPPHLDDAPRSRRIRKLRPLAEVALVLGWSLCFWLNHDIWTVVGFHILVDVGLMLKVRPLIFGGAPR